MKLLLTSGGVTNPSIRQALVDLLGKPVEDSSALAVPTASWGHPRVSAETAYRFYGGNPRNPMTELGWRSLGVLELTAVPTMDDRWVSWVRDADALLVNGGDALYLAHWIRESGLADLIPSLTDTVWVGMSAGSMVLTPRVGAAFTQWQPPGGGDRCLGLVDFAICPHLATPGRPGNSETEVEEWFASMDLPAYVMDDDTAIRVVDDVVDVVSEGQWRRQER